MSAPRHNEHRRPAFFRSGRSWWRDDGHGNQTEATDLCAPESARCGICNHIPCEHVEHVLAGQVSSRYCHTCRTISFTTWHVPADAWANDA